VSGIICLKKRRSYGGGRGNEKDEPKDANGKGEKGDGKGNPEKLWLSERGRKKSSDCQDERGGGGGGGETEVFYRC